ncbi:receptor-like protein kinase HSL1 [Ricinus communis]|uniref:receptor-like protein kinase HSL1 n=1 Tax=Ricinus communis TaxID=3988 RepID=UPI000772193E|nr:receptor-like protein kinase HSL1 [Ricinus communis]|eukprot:XP_015571809.1 receptor-like protein kinase HSL1 [Ricinus communis]
MSKITSVFLSICFSALLLSLLLSHVKSQQQLYDEEEAILLRLKQHWKNQPPLVQWTPLTSSHCTWPGINCTNSSVTGLNFANVNIAGTIPPFICDLKNLTVLDFGNNSIIGTFPLFLYNCSKLEHLDLSQNYFVGTIPDDIDRLSRLSFLNLYGNNFTGNIPVAIGRLKELKSLQLQQNLFNGTFPVEIGNLTNLEELMLAYNGFLPSRFPSNFTQLKKVKQLWFAESNLIGEIPEMIGDMAALELLDLSTNTLTGNLPSSLLMLKNLSMLYLHKNNLSGEIPRVVEALNLVELDLSDNNLIGTIPDEFGKLEKLSILNLFFNQLSGEIPVSIAHLPVLKRFNLFSNNLSGALPPELGLYSELEQFQVSSNRLSGRLPEPLCNGGKLVGVVAFDNNLNGELPTSLGNCSSLLIVSISRNAFSGNVPIGLWTALNLTFLMLSDNKFAGELPNEVSRNLARLEISNNEFSGKIPSGASWSNLVVFNASNNLFSGTIPQELTALPSLTTLLLDRNQLSGPLPSDIISWKSLNTINMSQNQLSGQLPDEITSLPNLVVLDLSDNQISGDIPPQLGSLKLNFLNLSSNHLTGEIPRLLENAAYNTSFLNNPGLCTSSSLLNLHVCNSRPQKSSKNSTRLIALISSILAAAFVLALLLSFFVIRVHQKKKQRSNSTWKFTSFHKLSFTESDILSKLTESNLIGSGGSGKVYRVLTNGSGLIVAVKRIWNDRKLDQKLEKEFQAEVEILGKIRHLNIVKLLCCICNDDSKLLVYEYMDKRSLDRWLHTKKRRNVSGSVCHAVLNWPTRFRIAVGVAQGLSYLHHDCLPRIVHRDVKSSNILLDSSFNAKIADFGLARMLIKQGEATVSAVAGSFGYIAPEYVQTSKVNEKVDVYSFGVVLLELTTGKEANFGDENSCLADWAWHHMSEGSAVVDALDKEIVEPSYLGEMSIVFKLGVKCTSKMPSARPSMSEALQILLQCSRPQVFEVKIMGREYDVAPLLKSSKREQSSGNDENE